MKRAKHSLTVVPIKEAPSATGQFKLKLGRRGNHAVYRHGEVNRCPQCNLNSWIVGRSSAQCARCDAALPFAGTPV